MPRRVRAPDAHRAVAYLRASTLDQRLGPEAQRAAIEAWAAREGVEVVSFHVDRGVSGGSDLADRPALIAAIAEMRAIGAGTLCIHKRDRLARDLYVAATIERAVAQSGARIVSADGTGNGDSAADAFMRGVLDSAAQYERALIRSRTRAALAAKRARGERTGECPYGYTVGANGSTLVEERDEQATIACARELRRQGRSLWAIVIDLASGDHVSRGGRPHGIAAVHAMVSALSTKNALELVDPPPLKRPGHVLTSHEESP